jgi:CMP-N-acetylneuraminic acid synthetase
MSKIIAMIPARIGSKRVPQKNLRMIDGQPLISYSVDSAIKSDVFDEVYINSDADIFSTIASNMGINFYRRPEYLGSDETNNDQFVSDFISKVDADILIQLLPTSPLITPEEIKGFVLSMLDGNYDTFISVVNQQIACIYDKKPINFNRLEPHISSQLMTPVQAYATVLMGWSYSSFNANMEKYGFAYHGGNSKIGYYTLKGLSEIDIDNEEDFVLAEIALKYRANIFNYKKEYYDESK